MNDATAPASGQTLRFPRRTLTFAALVVVLHVAFAYGLDAAGLVEALLSPSGADLLWLLPLAALFYAVRLASFFLVPGLVASAAILWLVDTVRARRS
ncbi:MAG: hypothetical protein IPM54_36530 [Polyangiaceae bacterium]|nr:hypothetical protein [Polyangiaceae bacterium]